MAKVSLFQIKQWFRKFQFPTQEQFWDTWDSFWHKDEQIPASQIDGLQQIFDAATSGFADELAEKQDKTDNSLDTENKTIAGAINELNHLIPQPKYVEINGVKWAKCNVDMPGTFAETPESAGMFYQINRNVGWSSTEPVVNSDGGTTWDSANPGEFVWEKANDPSPDGFRVPSTQEIEALLDTAKVAMANVTQNGVYGNRFTDIQTGNSIFIPAAGYRDSSGELYGAGESGNYAGGTAYASGIATFILQDEDVWLDYGYNASGWSIRPVFAPQEDNKKFYTVEGVYELNSENILEKILLTRANQIAGVSQQIDAGSLILVNGLLARITEIWEATNFGVTNLYGAAELVSNIRGEEIILAENPFDAANIANERLNKPTVIFLENTTFPARNSTITFESRTASLAIYGDVTFTGTTQCVALSFGDGVFNLNGTYKKIGGTAGTGSQDLLFESATTGNTTVNVSVGSELVGIGSINTDYLTVNFANITSTFRYNVFGNAIVNYPQKNTDVSLPSINIQSFPETLIDGAQNINAGFWGYRKKIERNITATRGGAIVQANHTSGTYAFAIYNAITKQLLGATNFANFGDNTTGNIYADFVQTVELQKDQEVYIVMYINYTSQRYLGCRTFRSELSGSGDIFGNGVMQTILYGSSMDVLSEITTSDISITYPNQNNIVAPYIEISGN